MQRRGFLRLLGGAIAVPTVAFAAPKIWIPRDQPNNEDVEIARGFVSDGQTVYGYLIAADHVQSIHLNELARDAGNYFPSGAPVLILSNVNGIGFNRNVHTFARFRFVGTKEGAVQQAKAEMVGAFDSSNAMFGWIADNDWAKRA